MADTVTIRIDLAKVAKNLSSAEGKEISNAEVLAFLNESGFINLGGGAWLCEEVSLEALHNTEWVIDSLRKPGKCWCGYDVRATPHRCPECGRVLS